MILMATYDSMDRRIRQGMHHLPTEQNTHSQNSNPPLSNSYNEQCQALPTSSYGPNYRTPQTRRQGCHPNYCRPRMLLSSRIPPMQYDYHRPTNCTTVPRPHLQMVRAAREDYLRPRSSFHFPLQICPYKETQYPTESLYCFPSPNRRAL